MKQHVGKAKEGKSDCNCIDTENHMAKPYMVCPAPYDASRAQTILRYGRNIYVTIL